MRKYNAAEEGSYDYYLWETEILRIANMIFDELNISLKYMRFAGK